MPEPMSALLKKIPTGTKITPKEFAGKFADSAFDGSASGSEMSAFFERAYECIKGSDKGQDRIQAMLEAAPLLGLSSSRCCFPKLNPRIVAFQMILRLMKPERVNQGDFGICGPAHFIVLLIKSRPVKYVRMAWDLLTKGKTSGEDGFEIVPDEHVKDFEPLESIPEADWLLAASLRNAKTRIPPGKDRGDYGGTKSPDVFAYCLHAGYSEIISLACYQRAADRLGHAFLPSYYEQYHPESLRKGLERFGKLYDPETNFGIACELRSEGWRVMLHINGSLFDLQPVNPNPYLRKQASQGQTWAQNELARREKPRTEATTEKALLGGLIYAQNADHWVLAKKISVTAGIVGLSVYTWGEQSTVEVDLTIDEFSNCYAGFVAARG